MLVAGIVAEYNPFHTGHGWQIAQTRAALGGDCAIICAMSGNWTQQADCAVVDKWRRTKLALLGGVDLVLELPTVWATASAEGFARAGVELLHATGVVDTLSFGSECGDADALARVAEILDSEVCREKLRRILKEGMPFAAARQAVVRELLGEEADLLSTPNNNLGVEYIRALNTLGSTIRPMTVRREGAAHNTPGGPEDRFTSATCLRQWLRAGEWAFAEPYLVPGALEILNDSPLSDLSRMERAMLMKLRSMSLEDWAVLPDSAPEEGLPQRLAKAGQQAASMTEFYDLVKTKRYTHARIRRLALMAYLGITRAEREARPAYLRVLGMSSRGQALLREMKKRVELPIIIKPAHVYELGGAVQQQFELEARCTDLYDLCLPELQPGGREWRNSLVKYVGE